MNAVATNRAFPAKFPGSCLCGARFQPGARIYWDSSARRATGCPSCATPKAVKGTLKYLKNGLVARFDTHPETGAVVACLVMDPCGSSRAKESFILRDGRWQFSGCAGEMVLSGTPSHEQIEGWRAEPGI